MKRANPLGALTAIAAFAISIACAITLAFAQSSPGLITGQVPTAAQWNSYFAAKQDYQGFSPLNRAGGVMTGLLRFSMTAPVLSSCGTGPSVTGNNQAGIVTMGTGSPTGCIITFSTSFAYSAIPSCVVSWQVNLASMQYVVTQTTITLTQTAASSNKVNYICMGLQ